MAKESFLSKINRFNEDVEKNISPNLSLVKKTGIFLDFLYEYKMHDTYLLDYMQYGFYWKTKEERKKYVVHGKLLEIMRKCNNPKHRYIFDEKPEFDKKFAEYIHREWIYTKDATYSDFLKFIENREDFFMKDPKGMFGLGVKKVKVADIKDKQEFFNKLKQREILCEETLTQCKEMAEFNDTSINTLRIVSMVTGEGNVKIMGGLLRTGRKGKIADNFHHQGIAAFIDPQTGVVITTGIDKDNTRHVFHPDSKKQIVGFHIPMWDDVVKTVQNAALVFPDMHYIGWDVVINKDNQVVLVEGNPGADPDAEQITTKEGRWPLYKEVIDGIIKSKGEKL